MRGVLLTLTAAATAACAAEREAIVPRVTAAREPIAFARPSVRAGGYWARTAAGPALEESTAIELARTLTRAGACSGREGVRLDVELLLAGGLGDLTFAARVDVVAGGRLVDRVELTGPAEGERLSAERLPAYLAAQVANAVLRSPSLGSLDRRMPGCGPETSAAWKRDDDAAPPRPPGGA